MLEEFGRNLAVPMAIADNVDGRVNGRISADTAQSFLSQVCAANNLAWFFDGSVIHVSNADDLTSHVIDLPPRIDVTNLMAKLNAMKIGQPLTVDRRANRIEAAGPQSWVAAVTNIVQRLAPTPAPDVGNVPGVRVFRGGVETRSTGAPKHAFRR